MDNWVSNPDENHGPLISGSIWSLAVLSAAFLVLRLHVRFKAGKLWIDDLLLTISWLFLLVQVILTQLSVNLGLGKHALDVDFSHLETITYYGAAGLTISIVAINLSKISFGVTLLRLTTSWTRWYVWFAIVTLAAFAVPVAVLPWVQCKPLVKTFVDIYPGECVDKMPAVRYGQFQAAWAALMDFSLALVPWVILWNVQIRTMEKIGVGIAMSLGILIGATAIVRAVYVVQLAEQDVSYDATKSVIWSAAESAVTVIATSIPVLRVFLRKKVDSAISYVNSSGRSRVTNTGTRTSKGMSHALAGSIRLSKNLSKKDSSRGGSKNDPPLIGRPEWDKLDGISETDAQHGKSATSDLTRSLDDSMRGDQGHIPHSTLQ